MKGDYGLNWTTGKKGIDDYKIKSENGRYLDGS